MKKPLSLLLFLLILLLLPACQAFMPSPTLTPSATATKTSTPIPTATKTQTPTATQTSTPLPPTATPTMTALEKAEEKLWLNSLNFLAFTAAEADQVARRIDFASGPHESADNACGPLTVAILKAGGYLPEEASEHEMWLLCPREDNPECHGIDTLNQKFFPPEEYDYIRVEESIGTYDWEANPLRPGDWLYLFVRKGVSKYNGFDHMIAVTRVDEEGAAYSVTNINYGEGFVITEALLYDPTQPGVGLFYDLTNDSERKELGMTGTAGFLLIRQKDPSLTP
ncbi:MAG TPA: hypothetical protein GX730_06180 [Chloroflexi bacterium]|nr:hypothetical protein [Chloroflexota bacterium]